MSFRYLFTPQQIGSVTVPNRLVLLPHTTLLGDQHLVGDRQIAYYEERAKGGVGLVIVETLVVHPTSQPLLNEPFAFDPRQVPRYRELTAAVHRHGARIFGQLAHGGRQLMDGSISRLPLWGVSPIPMSPVTEMPHEMDEDQIEELIEAFARCAGYLREGGFDGCELHSSHGYLIQQFISPLTNQRTDRWGGSLENRLRFPLAVMERVRKVVGRDFVLGMRLAADEFVPGGLTLDDTPEIARRLAASGQLDYLSVSGGLGLTPFIITADMSFPPGSQVHLAATIKREVGDLPVIAAQRINDPVLAERILADGHADLIGMARALICDPELPLKAREGRLDDIRPCIGCNQNCVGRIYQHRSIGCIQNAAAGREREWGIGTLKPAATPRRVVIVGGGPAGMEAARVARMRGHEVTLIERGTELGGRINALARVPWRHEFSGMVRYLRRQVENLGVKVRLGTEATEELILAERPDAVVIATGALPDLPAIPGLAGRALTAHEALEDSGKVGQRVLLVDLEGFYQTPTLAALFAGQGKDVEIIVPSFFMGSNLPYPSLIPLYMELAGRGVQFRTLTHLRAVEDGRVQAFNVFSMADVVLEGFDTLVVAYAGRADDRLYRALRGKVGELHLIGDAVAPRRADMAILEGHDVGRRL